MSVDGWMRRAKGLEPTPLGLSLLKRAANMAVCVWLCLSGYLGPFTRGGGGEGGRYRRKSPRGDNRMGPAEATELAGGCTPTVGERSSSYTYADRPLFTRQAWYE